MLTALITSLATLYGDGNSSKTVPIVQQYCINERRKNLRRETTRGARNAWSLLPTASTQARASASAGDAMAPAKCLPYWAGRVGTSPKARE